MWSGRVWAIIAAVALLVAGVVTFFAMPADASERSPEQTWQTK